MTSHCLCLREERIVRCLILRIVYFLFYLKVSYNFSLTTKIFSLTRNSFCQLLTKFLKTNGIMMKVFVSMKYFLDF